MPRQFKTARKMCKLKLLDAAKELGVSQPTLSSWESGRKSPTIDSVLKMADLYNVSVDFLLGRVADGTSNTNWNKNSNSEIPLDNLRIMHGQPVWSNKYGWMIVDSINQILITADNVKLPFSDADNLYYRMDDFSEGIIQKSKPLSVTELIKYDKIWVEPISLDFELRRELRGWYNVMSAWVENSSGNRFLFDTYESKWLGYHDCPG